MARNEHDIVLDHFGVLEENQIASGTATAGFVPVASGTGTAAWEAPSGGSGEQVKVSSNDTTAGYLNGKLVAGTGITLTENNDGANETLTIESSGGPGGGASLLKTVRVATTSGGTLATSFENGDTIDGVVLATGDRILVKNQSTASQNGIYVVAASGTPARADDFNSQDDISGSITTVREGTTNSDTSWQCSTNGAIVVDTTSLTFVQCPRPINFSGTGLGAVNFQSTASILYSPNAWNVGDPDSTWVRVGDTSGYISSESGDALVGVSSGSAFMTDAHTPADTAAGITITVGTDAETLHINEKASNVVQLWSDNADIELYDQSEQWYHRSLTDVVKQLQNMECRMGSSATATIASGSTSIAVTHGAGYTPSAQDITVTPTNNPTNDPGWFWISAIGATQFTINVRNDPGVSTATFAWRVDR